MAMMIARPQIPDADWNNAPVVSHPDMGGINSYLLTLLDPSTSECQIPDDRGDYTVVKANPFNESFTAPVAFDGVVIARFHSNRDLIFDVYVRPTAAGTPFRWLVSFGPADTMSTAYLDRRTVAGILSVCSTTYSSSGIQAGQLFGVSLKQFPVLDQLSASNLAAFAGPNSSSRVVPVSEGVVLLSEPINEPALRIPETSTSDNLGPSQQINYSNAGTVDGIFDLTNVNVPIDTSRVANSLPPAPFGKVRFIIKLPTMSGGPAIIFLTIERTSADPTTYAPLVTTVTINLGQTPGAAQNVGTWIVDYDTGPIAITRVTVQTPGVTTFVNAATANSANLKMEFKNSLMNWEYGQCGIVAMKGVSANTTIALGGRLIYEAIPTTALSKELGGPQAGLAANPEAYSDAVYLMARLSKLGLGMGTAMSMTDYSKLQSRGFFAVLASLHASRMIPQIANAITSSQGAARGAGFLSSIGSALSGLFSSGALGGIAKSVLPTISGLADSFLPGSGSIISGIGGALGSLIPGFKGGGVPYVAVREFTGKGAGVPNSLGRASARGSGKPRLSREPVIPGAETRTNAVGFVYGRPAPKTESVVVFPTGDVFTSEVIEQKPPCGPGKHGKRGHYRHHSDHHADGSYSSSTSIEGCDQSSATASSLSKYREAAAKGSGRPVKPNFQSGSRDLGAWSKPLPVFRVSDSKLPTPGCRLCEILKGALDLDDKIPCGYCSRVRNSDSSNFPTAKGSGRLRAAMAKPKSQYVPSSRSGMIAAASTIDASSAKKHMGTYRTMIRDMMCGGKFKPDMLMQTGGGYAHYGLAPVVIEDEYSNEANLVEVWVSTKPMKTQQIAFDYYDVGDGFKFDVWARDDFTVDSIKRSVRQANEYLGVLSGTIYITFMPNRGAPRLMQRTLSLEGPSFGLAAAAACMFLPATNTLYTGSIAEGEEGALKYELGSEDPEVSQVEIEVKIMAAVSAQLKMLALGVPDEIDDDFVANTNQILSEGSTGFKNTMALGEGWAPVNREGNTVVCLVRSEHGFNFMGLLQYALSCEVFSPFGLTEEVKQQISEEGVAINKEATRPEKPGAGGKPEVEDPVTKRTIPFDFQWVEDLSNDDDFRSVYEKGKPAGALEKLDNKIAEFGVRAGRWVDWVQGDGPEPTKVGFQKIYNLWQGIQSQLTPATKPKKETSSTLVAKLKATRLNALNKGFGQKRK